MIVKDPIDVSSLDALVKQSSAEGELMVSGSQQEAPRRDHEYFVRNDVPNTPSSLRRIAWAVES